MPRSRATNAPSPMNLSRARRMAAWRSNDVTALRMRLAFGGGSALAALPPTSALPAMGQGDS